MVIFIDSGLSARTKPPEGPFCSLIFCYVSVLERSATCLDRIPKELMGVGRKSCGLMQAEPLGKSGNINGTKVFAR